MELQQDAIEETRRRTVAAEAGDHGEVSGEPEEESAV